MSEPVAKPFVRSTFLHPGSLAVWLGVQALALSIAAFQFPLSDQFPRPAEKLALAELVTVQLAVGAMLGPMLFRNLASSICVIAASWPMLQLAGYLSSTAVLSTSLYVSMWLGVFALLNLACRRHSAAGGYLSTLLTAFTVGGALLAYLNAEFNPDSIFTTFPHRLVFGPIPSALVVCSGQSPSNVHWMVISILTGVCAAAFALCEWLSRAKCAK